MVLGPFNSRYCVFCLVFVWIIALPARLFAQTETGKEAATELDRDPLILHAQSQLAEADGNDAQALTLLQEAITKDPTHPYIAFDLARISLNSNSPSLAEDSRPFLGLDLKDADSLLLRAYILEKLGQHSDAQDASSQALELDPQSNEARRLFSALEKNTPISWKPGELAGQGTLEENAPEAPPPLYYMGKVQSQFDSNVTLLPDTSGSRQSGYRMMVEGAAVYTPLRHRNVQADITGFAQYAAHVNNRSNLARYDIGTAMLLANLEFKAAQLFTSIQAMSQLNCIDNLSAIFSNINGLRVESAIALDSDVRASVFVNGMYRNFVAHNKDDTSLDRDGPRAEAGTTLRIKFSHLTLGGHVAWQREQTSGRDLRENGLNARIYTDFHASIVDLQLAVFNESRFYQFSRNSSDDKRRDQQLAAEINARIAVHRHVNLTAGYSMLRNFSTSTFDYTRHLGQLGVETTW